MKRTTRAAPKAPPLYTRIRQTLNLYTKLLVVAKGHALRDQLTAPQTPPESFDALGQIFDALPRISMSAAPGSVLPRIRHAARGESWYPGYGLPGATRERASHGG